MSKESQIIYRIAAHSADKGNDSYASNSTNNGIDTEIKEEKSIDITKEINRIKLLFHKDRKLLVKHLPRNVSKQEISNMLKDYQIKYINLNNSDDTSSSATVILERPELLDEWNYDKPFLLRGQSVCVKPTPTEMLLCVARLPFNYTEQDLYKLMIPYGEIKTHFLMISEKTGKSKGYGFVQYVNKESALAARNGINDRVVDTFQLVCDWLDPSHITFNSLHSKCLYVGHLPQNFRDMGEFRKIFSTVVNPPYCQIALKNGCPLDWGLVEYLTWEDAEISQISCNDYCLRNQRIRVVFYIPGVRAMNLFLRLLNDSTPREKSAGLLPDPSDQAIMMNIQNLSKQNPVFAQSLKNIILGQIQESKHLNYDDHKPKGPEPTIDDLMKQPGPGNVERVISPIVNPLPLINAQLLTTQGIPLTPLTTPVLDKINIHPSMLPPNMKENLINYQIYYNDLLANRFSNGFLPLLLPPESPTFAPPLATNFMHELSALPIPLQRNIINVIGNAAAAPMAPMPNMGLLPQPSMLVQPPVLTPLTPSVEQHWSFPSPPETVVPNVPHPVLTMPMASTQIPSTWVPEPTVGSPAYKSVTDWKPSRLRALITPPTTPVTSHPGQKRKLLPSPESSPEGNYIGQHSQGIGGHYADSYFKRSKMS